MKIFKYAGITAVLLEQCSLVYFAVATKHPLDLIHPISYYGTIPAAHLVFSIVFSVAGLLFLIFGIWLAKELSLPKAFIATLCIALVSQLIMSWLPGNGAVPQLHYIPAIIVGICMPILGYIFARHNKNPTVRHISLGLVHCQVLALLLFPASIYLNVPLLPELVAGISFHIWIILATFERRVS